MAPGTGTLTPGRRTANALGPASLRPKGSDVSIPDKFEMVSAVVLETRCSDEAAEELVSMLAGKVKATERVGAAQTHTLTTRDLEGHRLFAQVMPDNTASKPGSAHATLEHGLGARLTHTRGGRDQCVVQVEIVRQ